MKKSPRACRKQDQIVRLSDYPTINTAIECDGAIRMLDGRYRYGFVNMDDLQYCIVKRLLVVEVRDGVGFAVKPNTSVCGPSPQRAQGTQDSIVGGTMEDKR